MAYIKLTPQRRGPHAFRPLGAFAIGLACLLTLGSCASEDQADPSQHSATVRLGATVIARVNGSAIYASDMNDAAIVQGHIQAGESIKPDHEQYNALLDELIDQRLLAQKARKDNLHKRADAVRRIAVAQERILGNIIVEEHLAETVTEEAARKLYDAQMRLRQGSEEARARHILVETKANAEAAKKRLEAGEEFSAVAFDVSLDQGTRAEGGDLGYFQADAMVAPFSKAVFALKKDEISMPFQTQFGWHIAQLTDRRAAPKPSFEDMRDQMINFLTYDEIKSLLEILHEEAEISIIQSGVAPMQHSDNQDDPSAPQGGVDDDSPGE